MVQLPFVTVDVFTTKAFTGNPLAVVFLPEDTDPAHQLTQRQKHQLTLEFNLSETIFVHPVTDPKKRTIDIFTLEGELPFAGHPTIGAANWFLCQSTANRDAEQVTSLITKSGEIPISIQDAATGTVAAKIAHNTRIHAKRFSLSDLLYFHPTLKPYFPAGTTFPLFSIVNGISQLFIELPSLEALSAVSRATGGDLIPTEQHLDAGWQSGILCVYFFVRDVDDEVTGKKVIRSRMMLGALEDPATGSSASGLAAWLALTEGRAGEEYRHLIVQGVEMGRRSDIGVNVKLDGEGKIAQVELTGSAVRVSEGKIAVPES
ncbi:putative isomerase [Penicillium rolfsii]|nr:putative isomerase [Penicillium rolfsii]